MIEVLGADAEHQGILDDAAAEADAVVHVHDGRGVHDAGQLRVDGFLVLAGEVVVIAHAFCRGGAAAGVFHFNGVGAEFLDEVKNVLPAGHADGDDEDDRGGSDDHAERGEDKARLAARKLSMASLRISLSSMVRRALSSVSWKASGTGLIDWVHCFLKDLMRQRPLGLLELPRNCSTGLCPWPSR